MEQVDAVARKIDRNQDGFISKGELEGWIMNSLRFVDGHTTYIQQSIMGILFLYSGWGCGGDGGGGGGLEETNQRGSCLL